MTGSPRCSGEAKLEGEKLFETFFLSVHGPECSPTESEEFTTMEFLGAEISVLLRFFVDFTSSVEKTK